MGSPESEREGVARPAGTPGTPGEPARSGRWIDVGLLILAVAALGLPYVTRAYFALDDYRYLMGVEQLLAGAPGAWRDALIVENRWDDCWWVEDGTFVRFFRPLITPTYLLDHALWGRDPRGYALTNLVFFLGTVLCAHALFARWIGGRIGPLVGALAFALHASHSEHLYYIAGRPGVLAGVPFLAVLLVHDRARRPSAGSTLAVGALTLASLCAKEWAVSLPLLLVAADRWCRRSRRGWRELVRAGGAHYAACVAAVLVYLALRALALGADGSGARPFPYFFMPERDGFVARSAAVLGHYAASLVTGVWVAPFLEGPSAVVAAVGVPELVLGLLALSVACVVGGRRSGPGRWFVLLGVVSLVPLVPLYTSARYLFLPSVAWCGLLGLAARACAAPGTRAWARRAGAAALVLLVAVPAARNRDALAAMMPTGGGPTRSQRLASWFEESGLALDPTRPLFLLEFPGPWYEAQFLPFVLGVELGRELPPIHVLTMAPWRAVRPLEAVRIDAASLELWRGERFGDHDPLHVGVPGMDFDQRRFDGAAVIDEAGYRVQVRGTSGPFAARIRVLFDRPLEEVDFARGGFREGRWHLERWRP